MPRPRRWRRRRKPPARGRRPVPMTHCPGCDALLPERPLAYALHASDGGFSVRLSVDLDAEAVHIDLGTPSTEPFHAATVEGAGTVEPVLRIWDPVLSPQLLRRLAELTAHAWQRASQTKDMRELSRLWQSRRAPVRPMAAPSGTVIAPQADGELFEAGEVLDRAEPGNGPEPAVDRALATIYAEIDEWIDQYGPEQAPAHLQDPAALCAAIAMVFDHEIKHDPKKVIALAAGAMTRLILPPERHQLPPDPFKEAPQ